MAFDFKREYKELYQPKCAPVIVEVPRMSYVAVRGNGDPNERDGAYQRAVSVLYGISYTIKMSYKGGRDIEGFFEYVVPPLEGLWQQKGVSGVDLSDKAGFDWVSLIRLPDFVSRADFEWAVREAGRKKGIDCSAAELLTLDEGLCVQMMHIGSYDSEPRSVEMMDKFIAENGYANDISAERLHHEIYLSDPNKVAAEKRKTVIRHPIKRND